MEIKSIKNRRLAFWLRIDQGPGKDRRAFERQELQHRKHHRSRDPRAGHNPHHPGDHRRRPGHGPDHQSAQEIDQCDQVVDFREKDFVDREMALIKVNAEGPNRAEILRIVDTFGRRLWT